MIYFVSIVLGLCIGSFLNVLVLRLDRKEGIMAGRSECPKCYRILGWHDLVPLVSYLLLRGRCRYCAKPISWRYPLVELFTSILVICFVYQYGYTITWQYLVIFCVMLGFWTLFLFDLTYYILPDKIIFPLVIIAFLSILTGPNGMLISFVLTGLLTAGAFAILYLVSSGRWMGFGDVKLALLLGLFFGYPTVVPIVFVSIWLAAIVGIGLIFARRASMKTALPFGSFLSAVSIIAILFYDKLSFIKLFF